MLGGGAKDPALQFGPGAKLGIGLQADPMHRCQRFASNMGAAYQPYRFDEIVFFNVAEG